MIYEINLFIFCTIELNFIHKYSNKNIIMQINSDVKRSLNNTNRFSMVICSKLAFTVSLKSNNRSHFERAMLIS